MTEKKRCKSNCEAHDSVHDKYLETVRGVLEDFIVIDKLRAHTLKGTSDMHLTVKYRIKDREGTFDMDFDGSGAEVQEKVERWITL